MERREKRWFRGIAAFLIAAILITIGAYLYITISSAPKISTLDAVPKGYRSSVLDDEGNIVLTLSQESSNRVYVKLAEIPDDLQHAVVAVEDERFYRHHGIDVRGILRAVWRGIRNGGMTEGASTITQQLLKNNVFTGWTEEDGFEEKVTRKIQEQFLAVALERKVTKNWILENYLNTINLGGGNWGVETAAKYYFDKDVSELTLSECAALAGITKNPTKYNPLTHAEANSGRREIVLKKMLEQEYITQEMYEEAMADPVYDRIAQISSTGRTQEIMTYFEDAMIYELIDDLEEETGCTEDEAWDLLYSGGLTVYSTENSKMQEICEETAMDDSLFKDEEQVSIVLIDNATGQVRAMVGGRGRKEGSLLYNRATSSLRQPGSTIKVIGTYAAAIDGGQVTLGTIYDDAPYSYSNGTAVVNATGTYAGKTTVRNAITSSNNIVALKCFQDTGMENVITKLQKFGISTLVNEDHVEALALGGTYGGVTNLEMTAAYASVARGGEYREPVYYTKVLDREGNLLLEREQEVHDVISADSAMLLTSAMSDVVAVGTGQNAAFADMDLAGKSGTTNEVRDAWFIGYSPYLTCGVWGGYDDNSPQEESGYIQVVWRNVMSGAHEGLEALSFREAGNGSWHTICTKCGKLAISGTCDHTLQGDVTAKEFYVTGTEPTEYCDCHVTVKVCTESGQPAGNYCTDTVTKTYLVSATEGTEDEKYRIPDSLKSGTCETHRHFWSGWGWGRGNSREETEPGNTLPGSGSSGVQSGHGYPGEDSQEDIPDPLEENEEPDQSGEPQEDDAGESEPEESGPDNFWSWLFGN
ncbi:MAG: PBP1A family penicillin-binding protein [Lachnospiraceae bacterium]|nr:PBP1A family penicillin-binding protein [Lachnospiraceae bacterium]